MTPPPDRVRAFAPASGSNFSCGFDALGMALDGPGDRVCAQRSEGRGARIARLSGVGAASVPTAAAANTATVAVDALLAAAGVEAGIALSVDKGIPPASGLGSSAASAAAAVVAVDALLGLGADRRQQLAAVVEGERAACGSAHADNAAPALVGGMVLVRRPPVLDFVPLHVPAELVVVILQPQVEVATRAARRLLPERVRRRDAVAQGANLAVLAVALEREDYELLATTLVDHIAEPVREPLVPFLTPLRRAAREAGALGAGLCGSGPSIYAFCRGRSAGEAVAAAMAAAFRHGWEAPFDTWLSVGHCSGARLLDGEEPAP